MDEVSNTNASVHLKENIALLSQLTEFPGDEEEWLPSQDSKTTPDRQLSLDKEGQLVDELAFIMATSEDPSNVIAVCVEEHHGSKGMTIRLAMNKGDLTERLHAMGRIAGILEKVASQGSSPLRIGGTFAQLL